MSPPRRFPIVWLGLVGMTVLSATGLDRSETALAVASTVTGRVYQDFNSDGTYDTTLQIGVATDVGVAGVAVRAFDSTGTQVGSTTTGTGGTYTLTITGASTSSVRVEFEIPTTAASLSAYQPSFAATTGASGSTLGTTVQFATVGDTGVDLGINVPGEYCQNNPTLVTCVSELGTGTADNTGAFTLESAASGFATYDENSSRIGSSDDLGAVFGIGTDRTRNAFFGTYVKRHVEYGDAGAVNAIYRVNLDNPDVVTTFVTLPGTLPAHDGTPPGSFPAYTGDTGVFDDVGRIGLGDVDVTPDGSTLLAVDMDETDPKLWFVPILGSGNSVTSGTPVSVDLAKPATFGTVTCPGTWHPMGLGVRRDRILVGGVCGAENTVSPSSPRGTDPTSATMFVLEYTGDLDGTGSFATIWASSLGYERTCLYREGTRIDCNPATTGVESFYTADWAAWNEYPNFDIPDGPSQGMVATDPQPMLSNIEITDSGDLIISLRDRYQDQAKPGAVGYSMAYDDPSYPAPPKAYPSFASTFAGGDIVRACSTGSGFTLETNGTCANLAGSQTTEYGGGKEYYYDGYPGFADGNGPLHPETATGATATMPGYSGVWGTVYDVNRTSSQGVMSWGSCDAALGACRGPVTGFGSQTGGYDFGNLNTFYKGNGMADLEILCDEAPLQVGNRVWRDLDGDGIQDPGEPPIAGVTVRLYDDAGTLVGTAVTNSDGEYYFSSTVSESAAGNGDAQGGGLAAGEAFTIRFDNPDDYASGGPLENHELSDANQTTSTASDIEDAIDTDATLAPTYPSIPVPATTAGHNDHTYDAGFRASVSVGNFVWIDSDADGIQDAGEPGLAGVELALTDLAGNPVTDVYGNPVTNVTTGADGSYLFENLPLGQYKVSVVGYPTGYEPTLSGAGTDAAADSSTDSATSANLQTAGAVDLTLDFGFTRIPNVSVGDFVWLDTDRDGAQDPGEPGLAGVELALTDLAGNPVTDIEGNIVPNVVTGADGSYSFDNLPLGRYKVSVVGAPAGYAPTKAGIGSGDTDSSTGSATSRNMTTDGDRDPTLDFGFVSTAKVSVGDRVWRDRNGDGYQSRIDPGIPGVRLRIFDANGNPARDIYGDPVPPQTTNRRGLYSFDNLPPGQYTVKITYPKGFRPTTADRPNRATNSSSHTARTVALTNGQRDSTLDFGIVSAIPWRPGLARTK